MNSGVKIIKIVMIPFLTDLIIFLLCAALLVLQMASKCIRKHKKYYEVRHCFGNTYFDTYTLCIQKNLNTTM